MLYLHHWRCRNKSAVNILQLISLPLIVHLIRDRPFNLKGEGGLWFFVSFRNFFSDNTRVIIFIFLSRKARNFFLEFNIRLYDKNSELDYFFFPPPKSEYFFSNIGNQNIFLEKNHNPPPFQVKWSFPYLFTEILLKVALNTITLTLRRLFVWENYG